MWLLWTVCQLLQVFNMRLKGVNRIGKLIHLRRFYVERCPMYLGWLERLTHALDEKPNKMEVASVMKDECVRIEKCNDSKRSVQNRTMGLCSLVNYTCTTNNGQWVLGDRGGGLVVAEDKDDME